RLRDGILGRAHGPRDVLALLAQAGWEPDEVDLDGPLIQWRGGEVGVVHQLGVDHPLGLAGHAAASALVRPAETASSSPVMW
ncbi:hypothetical protein KBZ21_40765, partial [Streptomyces sp. A73]|nr:hypothetical protein [Streptomyces sp. A73]